MATKQRLTNRFKAEYAKGSKKQKGEILDRLVAVGMGRSTARRLLDLTVEHMSLVVQPTQLARRMSFLGTPCLYAGAGSTAHHPRPHLSH